MWAQRLVGPGRLETVDVPDPAEPGAGQVVVRTTAGGICGSDLPFFRGGTSPAGTATAGAMGRPGFPLHEITGEVLASGHPDHEVGDVVVGWASAFDGLSERVLTDGAGLAAYDARLRPEVAILLQPLACVLYAVEQLELRGPVADLDVAVLGLGPIGMLFAHVLRSAGARSVTGVDRVDRRDLGPRFGVDHVVHAASDRWVSDLEADPAAPRPAVLVEAVGHQSATIGHAIRAVGLGGRIFYFGIPDESSYAVDLRTLLRRNLTLQAGATLDRRRVLVAAGDYLRAHPDLETSYVTDVLPAADAARAFELAGSPAPAQAKIAIRM